MVCFYDANGMKKAVKNAPPQRVVTTFGRGPKMTPAQKKANARFKKVFNKDARQMVAAQTYIGASKKPKGRK